MALYFTNPTKGTLPLMMTGELGFIDTPAQGNRRPIGVTWCADNGCFSDNFNEKKWWTWLTNQTADAEQCAFAVAPDVVGDYRATLKRSLPWLPKIRELGYPAAFVVQDGQTMRTMPWDLCDAIFIGGTTEWKFTDRVRDIIAEAKVRGKYVHMGRVNSRKRYRFAKLDLGCDSVDGTFIVFSPTTNLPRLLSWIREEESA